MLTINKRTYSKNTLKIMLALFTAVGLTACGDEEASTKKTGQSIVSVNGEEITVHQVNSQLQSAQIKPEKKAETSRKIVQSLIDREVLVQAAKDAKLDRNPNVLSAIEDSKMKILAKAYIQNKLANIAKPTESEIIDYRNSHKNVFENRKLYAINELSFTIDQSLVPEIEALSETAKSLQTVKVWLNKKTIPFKQAKAVHPAEKLPFKLLDKISDLSKGELIFINAPGKIIVGELLDTRSQPISLAQAKPLIERALMNQKQQKAAKLELERLKNTAEIVYLDESYSPSAIEEKSAKAKPKEMESDETDDTNSQESAIEKGLSGL